MLHGYRYICFRKIYLQYYKAIYIWKDFMKLPEIFFIIYMKGSKSKNCEDWIKSLKILNFLFVR